MSSTDEQEQQQQQHAPVSSNSGGGIDSEIDALKSQLTELNQEYAKLQELQELVEKEMVPAGSAGAAASGAAGVGQQTGAAGAAAASASQKESTDARSLYVGNVDYSATAEELHRLFAAHGNVQRVTILVDKFTGHPKGYAFVEYENEDSVEKAMAGLQGAELKGRALKLTPKRANIHGFHRGRGGPRGGGRGGRGRGGYNSGNVHAAAAAAAAAAQAQATMMMMGAGPMMYAPYPMVAPPHPGPRGGRGGRGIPRGGYAPY